MAIEFVIFDCDGTLVDTEPMHAAAVSAVLSKCGLEGFPPDRCHELFVGIGLDETKRYAERLSGKAITKNFEALFVEQTISMIPRMLKPVAGIGDVLRTLPVLSCVASNNEPEAVHKELEVTDLLPFFEPDRIYTRHIVPRGKPFPDLFLHIAGHHGVPASECLVIEDSVAGVRAAKAAGMPVLGFNGAASEPEKRRKDLLDAGARAVFSQYTEFFSLCARQGLDFRACASVAC